MEPDLALPDKESAERTCFIGRQPILDATRQLFGYELLFRSDRVNGLLSTNGDDATQQLIGHALSTFGLDSLTGNRLAFINFPTASLLEHQAEMLPPERVVVEILETVEPDPPVVEACRALKERGYPLALDDFEYHPRFEPLIELADFIKVDFRASDSKRRSEYARRFVPRGIRLLAEKVETWEEYREAADLGYTLFQGYFFCKPETLTRKALSPNAMGYLRLMEELNLDEVDFSRVERLIKSDAAMAVSLLSYLNSSLVGLSTRVTSVHHAIFLLGPLNLRRWANMMAILGLCRGKTPELFALSVLRARFCELLGANLPGGTRAFDLFLLGLLASADALLDRPLDQALECFGVTGDLRKALLEGSGPLGQIHALIGAYERAEWTAVTSIATSLGIAVSTVTVAYQQSLEWSAHPDPRSEADAEPTGVG